MRQRRAIIAGWQEQPGAPAKGDQGPPLAAAGDGG